MGIVKAVGKGVCQEVVLCCTHLPILCSATSLLPFLLPAALQPNNLPLFAGINSGMATFVCS